MPSRDFLQSCSRDVRVAWIAGLIEGEGCIVVGKRSAHGPVVHVSMADRDVIETAQILFGGTFSGPHGNGTLGIKPMYRWGLCGRRQVAELLGDIRSFMGERRKAKIDLSLAWIKESLDRESKCRQGHVFSEETTYLSGDGRRRCRICLLERRRRYSQRADVKARRDAYNQRPEIKARHREKERMRRMAQSGSN